MPTTHRSTRFQSPGSFEVVNVLDYGADATGSVESSVAIQNAVNLASSVGGGTVYLPPGTYKLTNTITVPTGCRIVGGGADATVITFAPTSSVFLFQAGGTTAGWFVGFEDFTVNVTTSSASGVFDIRDQARFFSFARLNLSGFNSATGTGLQLSGQASANSFHRIMQCRFRNFASCVKLSGFANGNLFIDSHFSACTDGLDFRTVGTDTLAGADNLAIRCEFNGSTTNAIHLSSTSVRNCFIKCVCDGPTNSVVGTPSSSSTTFLACTLNPDPPSALISSTGVTLIGCSYESSGASVDRPMLGSGLYLRAGAGGSRGADLIVQSGSPQLRLRPFGGSDGDVVTFMTTAGATSKITFQTGSPLADSLSIQNHDVTATLGDLIANTAGKGLKIKEGSNARMGSATLVGGSATVSTTAVTANSRIFVTSNTDGGAPGWLRVSARSNGVSFTITSSSGTDTSSVAWLIVEPA